MKTTEFFVLAAFAGLFMFIATDAAADKCTPMVDDWINDCTDHDGVKNSVNVCKPDIFGYCVLDITETGGNIQVTQHYKRGQSAAIVCLDKNSTSVKWSEKSSNAKFFIDFGASSPFPASVFAGGSGRPDEDDVSAAAVGCYGYSIKHCINGQACKQLDPKVIVGSNPIM